MKQIQTILRPFLIGIMGVLLMLSFMYFISLDLRFLFVIGILFYLLAGYFLRNYPKSAYVKLLILNLPQTIFLFLILGEIPKLYFMIPILIIASLVGHYIIMANSKKSYRWAAIGILAILTVLGFTQIPQLVQEQLTENTEIPAPSFTFQLVDGKTIKNTDLKGKVVVFDFFGTWCKPCIAELNELQKIKTELEEKGIVFYVINTEQAGDNLEKVEKFAQKRNFTFEFAMDKEGKMHQAFGFTGVPALAILDKSGNVRLKHEGYNASENFNSMLIKKLNEFNHTKN